MKTKDRTSVLVVTVSENGWRSLYMSRKKQAYIVLAILVVMIGIPVAIMSREIRHVQLNHMLIAAIEAEKYDTAHALLMQRADGTARRSDKTETSIIATARRMLDGKLSIYVGRQRGVSGSQPSTYTIVTRVVARPGLHASADRQHQPVAFVSCAKASANCIGAIAAESRSGRRDTSSGECIV